MDSSIAVATKPGDQPAARSRRLLIWSLALLPFLTVALWRIHDGPGIGADDHGQYLMHARALATGHDYTDIGYIHSALRYGIGPASAAPGLPVMLAAVYKVFGRNMTAMRLVIFFFAAAFVLLSGLYFARHADPRLGIGVALLIGLSPNIAHGATQLLTDLPFCALVWAVIYLVDKPGRPSWARILAIATLGAPAMAFRVPGVVLLPALLAFALLHYREAGPGPAIPLLIWTGMIVLVALILPIERLSPIRLHRLIEWSWADTTAGFEVYWPAIFESHLHPFPWPRANDVFHVFTGLAMVTGLVAWLRRAYASFAALFAFSYGAMLFLLPIHHERYLWPLFPLLVFGVLNGIGVLVAHFRRVEPGRACAAALAFAMVLVAPAMITTMAQPRRVDLMEVPEVQSVVQAIRTSAPGDSARVSFYKPRSFAWATGMPAMGSIGGSPACLIAELARGRITHVVTGSVVKGQDGAQQQDLRRLEASRPDLFSEVFRTDNLVVYRFEVPAAQAASAGRNCSQVRSE